MPTFDTAVIGTGIIGCSAAYSLSGVSGATLLVDGGGLCSGTSRASEGNLLVGDRTNDVELELMTRSLRRWRELSVELGDFEYAEKGSMLVASRTEDVDALERHVAWLADRGVTAQLSRTSAATVEPNLAPGIPAFATFPEDAQIQPMLACQELVRAFLRRGGEIRLYQPLSRLELHAGHVSLILASGEVIDVGRVVVAAGVWTPQLIEPLGVDIPVVPRRGHIAVLERGVRVRHAVLDFGYNATVSRTDQSTDRVDVAAVIESTASGTVLCGSSREFSGWDRHVDLATVRRVLAACVALIPALAELRVLRAYVGLRPFSPDGLPLIGWVAGDQQVAVATGHEGSGHGLAAVTADLVRGLFEGKIEDLHHRVEPLRFEQRKALTT